MVNILLKFQKASPPLPTHLGYDEEVQMIESKIVVDGVITDKTVQTPIIVRTEIKSMPIPVELSADDFSLKTSIAEGTNLSTFNFDMDSENPQSVVDVVNKAVAQLKANKNSNITETLVNNNITETLVNN